MTTPDARIDRMEATMEQIGIRLTSLETDVRDLRGEMNARFGQVDSQIESLRTDVNNRLEGLRTDMNDRIESLRTDVNNRLTTMTTMIFVTLGVVVLGTIGTIASILIK